MSEKTITILPEILAFMPEAIAIRHQIHATPELGFEEHRTSKLVAELLMNWGYEVSTRIAGTGVVGTLRKGEGKRSLGLRADMDALPIEEMTGLRYASQIPGKMHACGHDGHTTILLAAARELSRDPNFDGTLHLIFQPAEEGLSGAARMIEDGLYDRFPCDAVFAMHNIPGMPVGKFGFGDGAFMASADTVKVTINGQGGHGATPHKTIDPIVVCASIVTAIQSIIARNIDPLESAVISVGSIHSGTASSIIPNSAEMEITVRALSASVRDLLQQRVTTLIHAQASSFGATAHIDYNRCYPVLINHNAETDFARNIAIDWLGETNVDQKVAPIMASEDFAFMLEYCPGSYINIGNGEASAPLHNPKYDFNDDAIAFGATYWVLLVNNFLQANTTIA